MTMLKCVAVAGMALGLVGCASMLDNSSFYDGSMRSPAVISPDDYPICDPRVIAFPSVRIVLTYRRLAPFASGDGCRNHATTWVNAYATLGGSRRGITLVSSGGGVSTYLTIMDNPDVRARSPDGNVSWAKNSTADPFYQSPYVIHSPAVNLPNLNVREHWHHHQPIFDDVVTINGLQWRHYQYYYFTSGSSDPDSPDVNNGERIGTPVIPVRHPLALREIREIYRHDVDEGHAVTVVATYSRRLTLDSQSLEARRALLRRIVESVHVEPLTSQRLREIQESEFRSTLGGTECRPTVRADLLASLSEREAAAFRRRCPRVEVVY